MVAAVYVRKSNDQSGVAEDQKSVARQVEHARAFAVARGWTVDDQHVYIDDGISGAECERRPAFLRLMNALKPRAPFQALVMAEESRLGREAIETAYALKQLLTGGVRVFFYLDGRERTLGSATDKLLMSVTAFADEMEREKARQRTYDAMSRKAKAGHVTGGRTFGYDNVDVMGPDGRRSHVSRQINAAEAAVVRRIFQLTADGYGRKRIVQILNADLAPSPRAQRGRPAAWCPSSVHEALHRELYRGVIVWNQTRKRDPWGRQRQTTRPAEDAIRIEAPELRIIAEDVWTAVHARLSKRRAVYLTSTGGRAMGRPVAGTVSPYLLTGMVACGQCGGSLVVQSMPRGRRRDPRMTCWHYMTRGLRGCTNGHRPSLAPLEQVVLDAITDDVLTPVVVERAIALAMAELEAPTVVDSLRDDVSRELTEIDAELARLTAVVALGGADLPTIVEALRSRQARRNALVARQAVRAVKSRPAATGAALRRDLRARLADWRMLLTRNVTEARPVLELLLAGRVVVTPRLDGADLTAFDVRIPLSTRGVVEWALPKMAGNLCSQGVASPTGFEPVF
jgi:site-specific DNA recombinase